MALAILDKETERICHPDNDFSDILKVNSAHARAQKHLNLSLVAHTVRVFNFERIICG